MSRTFSLLFALMLGACAHPPAPAHTPSERTSPTIWLLERGAPPPAGTRTVILFNDGQPFIHVADGNYGPPILYHGKPLSPDQIKSIRVLKAAEARERFPGQNVVSAILIELK